MRLHLAAVLLAGTAAVLAVGLSAAPSSATAADILFTVAPGGAITAVAGTAQLKDTTTGSVASCASSHLSGTLHSGSALPGAGIGSITALAFATCTASIFGAFTLTAGNLPYIVNVTSYNASTGVTHGNITGIHLTFAQADCALVLDGTGASAGNGTVNVTYKNSTHRLKILTTGSNLHFYQVTGCLGLYNSGDAATLAGTYVVTPTQTIT